MKPTSSEPSIIVAAQDEELTSRLIRLLDEHGIGATSEGERGILERLDRGSALRLAIIADVDSDARALELLSAVKERRPDLAVLVLSSQPTIKLATDAIRRGAEDFVPVPYS